MTVKDLIDLLSILPFEMPVIVPVKGSNRDSADIGAVGIDFVQVFQRECKKVGGGKRVPVLRDAVLIRDESLRYGDSEMRAENRVRVERYCQRKMELEVQRQIDAYLKVEAGK